MRRVVWLVSALALTACGGSSRRGIAGQADLLADEDEVATVAGAPQAPGVPEKAAALTAVVANKTGCVAFTPDGRGAYVVLEQRPPGEQGLRLKVQLAVAGDAEGHGLTAAELADFDLTTSEDAMLGDDVLRQIDEKLPDLNAQIDSKGLMACQAAPEIEMGAGGFRRKSKELMAFPMGKPTKISIRDGGLYLAPADDAARKIADASEEGVKYTLDGAWFLSTGPGVLMVLQQEAENGVKRDAYFAEVK